MKFVLAFAIFASLTVQAQENVLENWQLDEDFYSDDMSDILSSMNLSTVSASFFDASKFESQPEFKEFEYVVTVNKANEGSDKQTLRMYKKGVLIIETKVSTGRENQETGATRKYYSTTPTGHFYPTTLTEKHYSSLWKTWMPYSVFFNGGIALHQVPAGAEGKLGQRASGGCVRINAVEAPKIFKMIKEAGKGLVPSVTRDGILNRDKNKTVIRKVNYKTLIIVQNKVL